MAMRWAFSFWRYLGPLAAPLLLLTLVLTLWEPVSAWLEGSDRYDREVLQEWIRESQNDYHSLGSLLEQYFRELEDFKQVRQQVLARLKKEKVALARKAGDGNELGSIGILKKTSLPAEHNAVARVKKRRPKNIRVAMLRGYSSLQQAYQPPIHAKALMRQSFFYGMAKSRVARKQDDIHKFLRWLAVPFVRSDRVRYPLFPLIYQIKIFQDADHKNLIASWDSELPRQKQQYQEFSHALDVDKDHKAYVYVQYHFRVYASRQDHARQNAVRQVWFTSVVALVCTLLLVWVYVAWNRVRQRQWHRMVAEQQVNEARRKQLEEELRRQDAERKREEAERANLELKSQLWANISILAGSYAHNIKNLLVRPNDLLSRCLEANGLSGAQGKMLQEVRLTLGTVTQRLQQILQTVRRDPTQVKREPVDLNELLDDLRATWQELAQEKWLLTLSVELSEEPVWIEGDKSNLQQAIENLLFNARDATFEMRNYLREQARRQPADGADGNTEKESRAAQQRRQALIAAASWRGKVTLRTSHADGHAMLEVEDNGIGMTEEVRRRCTETHFSTKRNNALFAGFSSGMGLGLSFIQVILEHHGAEMSIESEPLKGSLFRMKFPLVQTISTNMDLR